MACCLKRLGYSSSILLHLTIATVCALAQSAPQKPNLVHGTIVVVVSTKDGFVLAGDSQGTDANCRALPKEYEKVFAVGKRSGIVIAGLIGSQAGDPDVASSVAKQLHLADEGSRSTEGPQPQATTITWHFFEGVRSSLSLMDITVPQFHPLAAASAVSISDAGVPEWITVFFAPVPRRTRTGEEWGLKIDHFVDPPASRIVLLGSGASIVQPLIELEEPSPRFPESQEHILRQYYALKKDHRLADLSLIQGEELARTLVHSAISFADAHPNDCYGIGGDIQMVAITKEGPRWIAPLDTAKIAPPEPDFSGRIINSQMFGAIDGGQWVRGVIPADAVLTFSGHGDVHVIQPRSLGHCTLLLEPGSEKMPATITRLRSAFSKHCDIYREDGTRRVLVSKASAHGSSTTEIDAPSYSGISNQELKSKAHQLGAHLRRLVNDSYGADRVSEQEWEQQRWGLGEEDGNVLGTKYSLLKLDRQAQLTSDYYSKFYSQAIAIWNEITSRLPPGARVGQDASHYGTTSMEMEDVANGLDEIANKLSSN